MDTHFENDLFFTTLLQSGGGDCNSIPTQHSNVVIQATTTDGEKRHHSKKVQRGASFTVEEDNLLVSAWLNISIGAIMGTDQKSTQMWERITTFYHEYKKPNIPDRSEGSLMNRWSTIQKLTNKFCAYIAQIESLHPSGATEQDNIEKAKMLYKEMRKPQEKYVGEVDVDLAGEDLEVLTERPPGKKAEKERERKRKSMEGKEVEIKTALAKMTEDRATTMEERRNAMLKADEKSEKIVKRKRNPGIEERDIRKVKKEVELVVRMITSALIGRRGSNRQLQQWAKRIHERKEAGEGREASGVASREGGMESGNAGDGN
ncbi:uncharacterized protein LOC118347706 [Juglans regia]|uniref:Uncharacterized protein LOC118347706 n=1 Tax=Juglans regia TaxID=51240 RepID=A0A6P9ELV0_JUGRE|nr:uncharacterized protein LOC118347706 [Juglans regia]